jgi:hypothetical protein
MRLARWSLVAVVALAVHGSADAQSTNLPRGNFSSGLTGIRPTDVQFRQIDTTALTRGTAAPVQNIAQGQSGFSLGRFFKKLFTFGSNRTTGVSPLPNPGTVPGWQFPNSPIKPMQPIIPTPAVP